MGGAVPPGLTQACSRSFSVSHANAPPRGRYQPTYPARHGHSPNTLPHLRNVAGAAYATRDGDSTLAFPSLFTNYNPLPAQRAHPAPQLASLPSRSGPARGGTVLGSARAPPWIPGLCRSAVTLLIQLAKKRLVSPLSHLCSRFIPEAQLFLFIWVLPILSLLEVVTFLIHLVLLGCYKKFRTFKMWQIS